MDDHPDASVELLVNRLKTALDEEESSYAERVKVLDTELTEARQEIQRILNHSHQVQESLEQLFQDDQAKRRQIEEMQHQLSELRRQQQEDALQQEKVLKEDHAAAIEQLSQDHAAAIEQLSQDHAAVVEQLSQDHAAVVEQLSQDHAAVVEQLSQDEATVKLQFSEKCSEHDLALEQLEYYFLQSRQKSIMLEKYEKLHEKSVALIQSSFGD